jgi:hypothetical protein
MDPGIMALFIPILALSIPIVAIVCNSVQKMYQMKLDRIHKVDATGDAALKKRLVELEQRVLTLQDIIIGGDYDVRRRLEQAITAQNMTPPPPAHDVHTTQTGPTTIPTVGS